MNVADTPLSARNRGRRRLLIVAAVFLGPFAAALVMHALGWQPGGHVNRGVLLSPPMPLPPFQATMLGARAPMPDAARWTVPHREHRRLRRCVPARTR
jgi:hypothetical protein